MQLTMTFLIFMMLLGCASDPGCVRVSYYDYGDVGCLQHVYQFRGKYYPGHGGIIVVDKYLGDGNRSTFEQCSNPADMPANIYPVIVEDGLSSWVLSGDGYKDFVDVVPHIITQKALSRLTSPKKGD
jgi:hypothetical protein